tara:strand:+ start:2622 stop:2891 length:270 start_codon:yes stop_codon:yes gene_type:complete
MEQRKKYKGYYTRKNNNSLTLDSYLSALPSDNKIIKRNDYSYLTNCVTHEDRNPSLCISQGQSRVVFKCYSGCSQSQLGEYFKEKLGGL